MKRLYLVLLFLISILGTNEAQHSMDQSLVFYAFSSGALEMKEVPLLNPKSNLSNGKQTSLNQIWSLETSSEFALPVENPNPHFTTLAIKEISGAFTIACNMKNAESVLDYSIERSFDGMHFQIWKSFRENLGITDFKPLIIEDLDPFKRTTYYQLKALHPDGSSTINSFVSVLTADEMNCIAYSNQFDVFESLSLKGNYSSYEITDLTGKVLDVKSVMLNDKERIFDISDLKPGFYSLMLMGPNSSKKRRMIFRKN